MVFLKQFLLEACHTIIFVDNNVFILLNIYASMGSSIVKNGIDL